jgi:beta-glucosidase
MSESGDAPTLSLPGKQNELISAVAAANPHTIVVLITGNPVTMPGSIMSPA